MKIIITLGIFFNIYEVIFASLFKKSLLSTRGCNRDEGFINVDEKKLILLTHNRIRNQIATQSNKIGPKIPFATNMIQMYYNQSIGAKAQEWADKCTFKHSDPGSRKLPQFATGENIFRTKFIKETPIKNWQNAIEDWFSEIKDFGGKSVVSFSPKGSVTGHFTQMIWAYSYFVGCGFSSYSDSPGEITPACSCPSNLGCNNVTFPGLCCATGHCNHNSIDYNGEPFLGTVPDLK